MNQEVSYSALKDHKKKLNFYALNCVTENNGMNQTMSKL